MGWAVVVEVTATAIQAQRATVQATLKAEFQRFFTNRFPQDLNERARSWCVSGLTKYLINRLKFNRKNVNKLLTQEHI